MPDRKSSRPKRFEFIYLFSVESSDSSSSNPAESLENSDCVLLPLGYAPGLA
ncbi:MAG: hypothetical protein LBS83_00705 [Holosporales bacterium]|nr:hypothetical protein [Holosporales bacterium]